MVNFKIDGYAIQGFIDRLSNAGRGVYEIHDYKTSGALPEQSRLDADRQLALYQIGIRERFRDVKDIKLIWHYLLFDQELTSARSEEQINELKQQIVGLIKKIEKDTRFEPRESSLCDWCEYQQLCPAKKHLCKVADLPLNKYLKEKGVSLVNKYAALKEQIKNLREQEQKLQDELDLVSQAAVEYARREEITSIDGSDFVLKIKESTDIDFPLSDGAGREELEKAVKKAGLWDRVATLNLPRLKKLIEDEELSAELAKKLLGFAETKSRTSLRLAKKEPPGE
jgi:putative RecB family exonuclease